MKINICSPICTIENNENAMRFYEELVRYINEYTSVNEIASITKINELIDTIERDNLLIIFNIDKDKKYSEKMLKLLKKANEKKALIWPVAMNGNVRLPSKIIAEKQSFDIKEHLENRETANVEVIAQIFAREVISEAMPTFYAESRKVIFVSHRRVDGEEIAAKLCDEINLLGRTREVNARREAFRDVVEVQVGENAQEVIDSALAVSDILIYLHTPKSVESDWIQKEVVYAILNGIPVLWIRIDAADTEKLQIRPSENPHLECLSKDFTNRKKLEKLVNRIEDMCFRLVMNKRNNVLEQKERYESWADRYGIGVTRVDETRQIYKAEYKENRLNKYDRKPFIQYIQYYGRTILEEDVRLFSEYLNTTNSYDTAVMVSENEHMEKVGDYIYKNGFIKHMEYWKNQVGETEIVQKGKKIIILGSFPEEEEYNKYVLTEAVNEFAHEIISYGYTLVFGAHPTFQKLIFNIVQEECHDPKQAVEMYISKWFTYDIDELNKYASIIEVEKANNIESSLRAMRNEMMEEHNVAAVIGLGGKIKGGAGVEKEIKIARKLKLPVFLVGSVGGYTEKEATKLHENNEWNKINDAGSELNEMFRSNLNYRKIFAQMDQYIKRKEDK